MFTLDGLTGKLTYNGTPVQILREQISNRGGGIEIDLSDLGYDGEKMAAYQNYLGGGLLGAVQVNDTIRSQSQRPFMDEESEAKLDEIGEALKRFFHQCTNPDDPYAGMAYEDNQKMPASGY